MYDNYPITNPDIWELNISSDDVRKKMPRLSILNPSQDILGAWAQLTYLPVISDFEQMLNSRLVGNSLIRRANVPIFDQSLIMSDVLTVLDIVHPVEKRFLRYEELVSLYQYPPRQLMYYSIITAIPRSWKVEIRSNSLEFVIDVEPKIQKYQKSHSISRAIYWDMLQIRFPKQESNALNLGTQITNLN